MNFKKLFWFQLASAALILSGFMLKSNFETGQLLLLLWCSYLGVVLVYRLNDCIDQDQNLRFNLATFLSFKLHQIVLFQLLFVATPLAFIYLDPAVFIILGISALVGCLYSLTFKLGSFTLRLKNIFLVKNVLIGLIWAALILIGARSYEGETVIVLFAFIAVQVFIGGMIRDIPDLNKDVLNGVATFPVRFGVKFTIQFMQLVNVFSLLLLYFVGWTGNLVVVIPGIVLWRALNLHFIAADPQSRMWNQWMNLFTCVLCFILLTICRLYEYYK